MHTLVQTRFSHCLQYYVSSFAFTYHIMRKKTIYTLLGILFSVTCYSQVIVPKYVKLPADSTRLIGSLNGFLGQLALPDKDNTFVLKENLLTVAALMDEMKGMTDAGTTKKGFYKCYLTNVTELDSTGYIIQLSYLGTDGPTPVLKASFKLIAQKQADGYNFNSVLKRNTLTWPVKKVGSFIIYRNTSGKVPFLDRYVKKAMEFDKKLHAQNYVTEIYYCDNFNDALALYGVEYKQDYNSLAHIHISTFEGGNNLHFIGALPNEEYAFDLHDLWHNRLHHVVSTDVINKFMDEATAYLYGGSWQISWADIFKQFKTFMGTDHDWLKAFTDNKNFGPNQQYHLYVAYVIDALIAEKIEKEKGFPAVLQLITSGKREPDNIKFFKALDKITGINQSNFNVEVEKLVESERP